MIEYFRLNGAFTLDGMRDYEDTRVAGFVWFATGTCMILFFYEVGLFPELFAISTIIMASFIDPLIGEVTINMGKMRELLQDLWVVLSFIMQFLEYYFIH